MNEKSRKIFSLENTMKTIFQNLMDCFGDKRDLVEDIEEEVKALPHIEIIDLKTKIIR